MKLGEFRPEHLCQLREMSLDPITRTEQNWYETGRTWKENGITYSVFYKGRLVASIGMILVREREAHVWGVYSMEVKKCAKDLIRLLRQMLDSYTMVGGLKTVWTTAAFPKAERWVRLLGFKPFRGILWIR